MKSFLKFVLETFTNRNGEPLNSKHSKEEVHNNKKSKNIKENEGIFKVCFKTFSNINSEALNSNH
jgi:hypothetical protein